MATGKSATIRVTSNTQTMSTQRAQTTVRVWLNQGQVQ